MTEGAKAVLVMAFLACSIAIVLSASTEESGSPWSLGKLCSIEEDQLGNGCFNGIKKKWNEEGDEIVTVDDLNGLLIDFLVSKTEMSKVQTAE